MVLFVLAALSPVRREAYSVELDGVTLPDTMQVDGRTLHLNGLGLRTYSFLAIHIYVAGLYLEHLSTDPEAIIRSPELKLLTVRFQRDVGADAAQKAWREGLGNNCQPPCHLDPEDLEKFLAEVPEMHTGDTFVLLFTQHGATVTVSGRPLGAITHRQFADAMLSTFLGPKPASPALKQALLRGGT